MVDGAEGGTGAAPVEFSNRVGMPLREGLILVRNALVGTSLKSEVKLAAAGMVHSGAGMATISASVQTAQRGPRFHVRAGLRAIDECHADTADRVAAGCDPPACLVPMEKAEKVARFQRHTLHSFREMVVAMGLDNPWQIEPGDISERLNGAQSDGLDRLHGFSTRALLDTPDRPLMPTPRRSGGDIQGGDMTRNADSRCTM